MKKSKPSAIWKKNRAQDRVPAGCSRAGARGRLTLRDGIRIFDVPGGRRYDWELVGMYEGAERSFGRIYRPKLSGLSTS